MQLHDTLHVRGHIRIDKYDADGQLYDVTEADNIFLTTGINEIWKLVTGQSANTFTNAQAQIGIGDSAAGTDAAAIAAQATASDIGSAVETVSVLDTVGSIDSGLGAESASVGAVITVADSGTGADSAVVDSGPAAVAPADAGTAIDTASVSTQVTVADSAAGTDSAAAAAQIAASDIGSAVETVSLLDLVGSIDSGLADDQASVSVAVAVSDAATGTDSALAVTAAADSAAGVDGVVLDVQIAVSDGAVGLDVATTDQPAVLAGGAGKQPRRGPRVQWSESLPPAPQPTPPDALPQAQHPGTVDAGQGMSLADVSALITQIDQAHGFSAVRIDKLDPDQELLALALCL